MSEPVVFGPAYSTYVRTVCLTLREKGVKYTVEDVDILKGKAQTPEYRQRHPFGKVPAFQYGDFQLYETAAIIRYVDEALAGPSLQPADVRSRARMNQIIAIIDSYGYASMVTAVVMERLVAPLLGGTADEAKIAAALPMCRTVLHALERLIGDAPYLAGDALSLADLHLAPVYDYFAMTPEGKTELAATPELARWWASISQRDSVIATKPALG